MSENNGCDVRIFNPLVNEPGSSVMDDYDGIGARCSNILDKIIRVFICDKLENIIRKQIQKTKKNKRRRGRGRGRKGKTVLLESKLGRL
jgi:hypothetical protein